MEWYVLFVRLFVFVLLVMASDVYESYMGDDSQVSGDVIFRESINSSAVPCSPLVHISDRLVVDAIRRASLTNRPSTVRYPPDFFNGPEEHSSSSSEDEKAKKKKRKTAKV